MFAGLLLAMGSLGDRYGRKGALSLGLGVFVTFSTLAAFTDSAGALIAARAVMGVGAALIFPATLAILANVFTEPRERAKAIGIWAAVTGAAVALGPVSGGFLLKHFWWGSVLIVNLPIGLIALALGAWLVPTSRDPEAPRLDLVGVALSIVAVAGLVYTIIEAPGRGWSSTATLASFVGVAAAATAFVWWERRVAVLGSLLASLYGGRVADGLRALPMPDEARRIAGESVGAAFEVARRATEQAGPEAGASIRRIASAAFMDGFHTGSWVAAGVALAGAAAALAFLPARASHTPTNADEATDTNGEPERALVG